MVLEAMVRSCLTIATVAPWLSAQLAVERVTPRRERVTVSPVQPIQWELSEPVSESSLNGATVKVWGRWGGAVPGAISLRDGGYTVRFSPLEPFAPGEMVTASLAPPLTGRYGGQLATTHVTSFWIAATAAQPQLAPTATVNIRLPGEGPIRSYGAYAGDIDNDGFPDLCVPNEYSDDVRYFRNDGAGNFSTSTVLPLPHNTQPSPIEGGDFNGDGWIDLVTANIVGASVAILLNDGSGGFLPAQLHAVGATPRGLAVFDADSDGDLDVVVANRNSSNLSLLRGDGAGSFQPASFFQGGVGGETALASCDADGDGVTDLFVGGFNSQTLALLLGDGQGNFTVADTVALGGAPWMIAAGDVDRDGEVDVVAALSTSAQVAVIRNDRQSGFRQPDYYTCGPFPVAVDLGDLDGDGDLDLISSEYLGSSYSVFRNLGGGAFAPRQVLAAPSAGSCALVVDLDGDEDVELVGIDELDDVITIFDSPPNPVQPPSNGAALLLDGVGRSAGFGGLPAATAPIGASSTLTVRGHPGALWILLAGVRSEPGLPTPLGSIGVGLAPPPIPLIPSPGDLFLDASGEATTPLPVPTFVPQGMSATFQALVYNPANRAVGFTLSNPIAVIAK